jgi:histidinol dehydrogenase
MKTISTKDRNFRKVLLGTRASGGVSPKVERDVRAIIEKVRAGGDKALIEYTRKFDGASLKKVEIEVKVEEIKRALKRVPEEVIRAMELAADRIWKFHKRQVQSSFEFRDKLGARLSQKAIPVEKAGVYVPGGKASYPSTVLMGVIPAKVAGVREVVVVTPPGRDGEVRDEILAAARIAGADAVYRVGGAQAVAALAYGTERIPRVDKIVGPGNIYVAAAKRIVAGVVGIDMFAGPSEIMVITDGSSSPEIVAADMISQAEHDENAVAVAVSTSKKHLADIAGELKLQLKTAARRNTAEASIRKNGLLVHARSVDECIEIANEFAPEHLELLIRNARKVAGKIRNAGSVFIGPYTPEAAGDYTAGPNHTLPTSGTARFSSPLGVYDFIKYTNFIELSKDCLNELADDIILLAETEGLDGHAEAVRKRLKV